MIVVGVVVVVVVVYCSKMHSKLNMISPAHDPQYS